MPAFDPPLSNVEAILQNALGAENEVVPQSRVEDLLDRLDKALEDMDIGTASNVITRVEDNKIKFISKEGGGAVMAIAMDGIYVNGQKAKFAPEDILSVDASAYTEEIGTAVEEWLEENVTGGEQVTDTTLTLPGVPADAKKTGNEIGALKEDLNAYAVDANLEFLANDVGHYVKSDGTLATSGAYRVSDYIPIPPYVKSVKIGNSFTLGSTVYHLSPALCLFDTNKTVITGQTGKTDDYAVYAIPSTAKYLRFNQPNEGNANVTNAVIGFWFVQTVDDELQRIENKKTVITLTFSSQQAITSNYVVKAGTVYRIEASATYASTEDASRINIYSNGDNTVYEIYKNTKPYIDFVCGADGKLNFYNAGGYTGTVTFYITANLKRSLDDDEITYYVGKNFEHYTSLTALLLDLKDDKRKKKIIVKGGDYDVYAEYKDLQDAGKLPAVPDDNYDPSTGYVPYNVFVPDNTHIIGEGLVRLNYMPTTSQTTVNEAATLSPINIAGSVILENLEIYVKHGRYCIHDDPIQDPIYTGGYKIYKNVKCYKYTSDTVGGQTFGSTYCFGCGISKEMYYEFDNCYMETQSTYRKSRTLYFHDRKIVGGVTLQDKNSSRIVIKNSVFVAGSGDLAMFFGNIGAGYNTDGLAIRVDIDSCWTNGNIVSADEADSDAGTKPNSYAFRIIKSKYNNLIIRDSNSKHTPQIYADPNTVTVSGSTPTITAKPDTRYVCGEITSLSFTPSDRGICNVRFTSGDTPTALTLPYTVKMPDWWIGAEANKTYEISIADGVYGAVMSWD